ncbi:hypothetical protein [Streptomyces sp. NRRL B-24484]|uniref:hypothetical protein n=1 Tax=Streptomyces sp. NRRL B-24484 TaxID=1463833 RepID=UPI001331637C|nr:hypothetical protein [Streptomyces sp. NRRL B-24484]
MVGDAVGGAGGVDWPGVFHALGPAVDTPGHLAALLGDPHAGVRGCAALAPGLVGDGTAALVRHGLARSPEAFARSFGDMAPPLQFQSDPYRARLTAALLWRADDARGAADGTRTGAGGPDEPRS